MAKDRSKKKQMTMQRSISTEMLRISLLASVLLFLVSLVLFFSIRTLTDNRMKNLEYQVSVSSSENLRRTISMSMRHRTDNTAKQLRAAMISYSELTGSVADFAERLYAGEIKGSKDVLPPNSHTSGQLSVQLLYSEGTAPGDPEVVRELEQLSLVSSMMESTLRSYTEISAAYIATESGICIMADYQAAGKYDRNGRLKSYEARDRYWYHKAKETQEPGLVMMKNDWFLKEPLFTWFEPVFDANKQVVAVVGLDILLSDFSEVLNRNTSNQYQNICVADKNGAIVYSSMNSGILSHSSNYAWNLRACPNRELASIVKKAIEGESGASILEIDGGRSYLGYAPVEDYDMIVLTMLPYERIMDPTQELTEMIHEVSVEELATIDGLMRNGYLYILSQLLILESLTAIVAYLIAGQLVKSIRRLSQKVREVHGENLEFVWEDDSENEVANLAEAFSGLTKRLRYYISNITQETIQRERAKTELSLATHIQQSFLPDIDELFTEKDDYEIQAFMRTAREVGGDLYDAFFLDD
ncbi:MAG: hypothetical protein IJV04_00875, partial [Lachnospiraceae bacterium]|nr:hypothetical protein [Lachnospiraceae bacterium]